MTINIADNTPRAAYTLAQGATQQVFTVDFEFFDDADLNVYVDETLQTITTDYITADNNDVSAPTAHTSGTTGFIHFTAELTGATGGSNIVITRDISIERVTDFPPSGAFQIASLNTGLDRLTAIAADLNDSVNRTIRLTDYDTTGALNLELPSASDRAGKFLSFDANGTPVVASSSGDYKGAWSAGVAYAVGDTVTDTTTNNVYRVSAAHTSSGVLPLDTNVNSSDYVLFIDVATLQTSLIESVAADTATALAIALG
jgi:hypothetical protein